MSFTNMRPVPGSSTRSIILAGAPSTSGNRANSTKSTTITPSLVSIGRGKGSLVPWAAAGAATSAAAITFPSALIP